MNSLLRMERARFSYVAILHKSPKRAEIIAVYLMAVFESNDIEIALNWISELQLINDEQYSAVIIYEPELFLEEYPTPELGIFLRKSKNYLLISTTRIDDENFADLPIDRIEFIGTSVEDLIDKVKRYNEKDSM